MGRWSAARLIFVAVLPAVLAAGSASAQLAESDYRGSAELGLALRKLGTTKRVLMVGAHPDDEQTQLLSTLALGQGAAVAYLSLTRGEGGQNGIGPEMQEGLGLLRTEELLAARRLDGAQQYFTRAIDFGFTKTSEEALRFWPREELLRDVVAVVRHFRPDVIISVFSGTPRDGHGQHQAAGIMAAEAFEAAGDPSRFPDLIEAGLRPHSVTHLYSILRGDEVGPVVEVATGSLDPLLGYSHFQVAMASRSRHRSQDMGRALTPGPQSSNVALVASRSEVTGGSLFAGVDTTLSLLVAGGPVPPRRVADRIADYEVAVADIRAGFNPLDPDRVVPLLVSAIGSMRQAREAAEEGGDGDLAFQLAAELAELRHALLLASGVSVSAIAEDETVVPGQSFDLEVRVWNGGDQAVQIDRLDPVLPVGWRAQAQGTLLAVVRPGEVVTRHFRVTVPADAAFTIPYFLRLPRDGASYTWPADAGHVGLPFEPDEIRAVAALRIAGEPVETGASARFHGVDPRSGEYERPIRVVPAVALGIQPRLAVVPLVARGEPVTVTLRLTAEAPEGVRGVVNFEAPTGWRVDPASLPIELAEEEERAVEFTLVPPASAPPGGYPIAASFIDAAGKRYEIGYTLVDYPHIRPRPLYAASDLEVQVIDVVVPPGLRVGYIAAPGDEVPISLAQLGVELDLLGPGELATRELSGYDVIVVGPRAYEGRPDLIAQNQRLLEYTRTGGTTIVQYNQYVYTEPGIAPFPVTMARPHDRVTDETAAVTFLQPEHPVLTTPNRITAADFEGWVQERGLYFLNTWDDRFTPLLEMADPGEPPTRGALLVADYGAGRYVYTGLALFRQLPAGVPGAYRLFANLLALGADR